MFIQLGTNPAPTLLKFAHNSSESISYSRIILITDHPELWPGFPGEVHLFDSDQFFSPAIKKYVRDNREYFGIANGYWMFTLQRLFALRQLESLVGSSEPILHVESDVLLTLSRIELDLVLQSEKFRVSVPRHSKTEGIGSILIAKNYEEISRLMNEFEGILKSEPRWISDMYLLGIALEREILHELPSYPDSGIKVAEDTFLLFDGAAAGQYLFGRDPVHSEGRVISGYINPYFKFDLTSVSWEIRLVGESEKVGFNSNGSFYYFANLHVHSKSTIGSVCSKDSAWEKVLLEANGILPRQPGPQVEDRIHTRKTPALARFRFAKKNGFYKTLKRKIDNFKFHL